MLKIKGKTDADAKAGWVYVLHDSAHPQEVKVGLTTRTVDKRVREFKTGRSSPLVEVWSEHVTNTALVEDLVFRNLKDYRVETTEFFAVEPLVAIHALQTEARPFRLDHPRLHDQRFGILSHFLEKHGRGGLVTHDALSMDICRTSAGIFLETCVRVGSTGGMTTSLRLLAATDPEVDDTAWPGDFYENPFSPDLSAEENAKVFLKLEAVTQAILTDALDVEAAAALGS
jgi:hypothetical protein